uniref:Uncharacterized protein n=1 Tax=Picea glauca TaxID=3330 RepID=A0A101LYX2_PICGL|nr:hypothetical protein ABT39_MTgene5945 [Picea glauca]
MPLARMKKKLSPGLTHMSVKTPHPHPQSLSLKKTPQPITGLTLPGSPFFFVASFGRVPSLHYSRGER